MSIFGELERFFATVIFPNCGLVAIGFVAAVAVLAVLARRRRWDRAVRAHPRRALAILVPVLVIGLPVAWVLGSPLFIRSELVEPGPVASADGGTIIAVGEVMGADDFHTGSGRVSVVRSAAGSQAVRFEDFSVLNGPDLFVYVSPDPSGYAEGAIELGALKATDGAFSYELPPDLDPGAFRSVVVWCRAFEVQFAHATLGPT